MKRESAKIDTDSLSSAEREQLKALQRENDELKTANEILRKASAFFAGVAYRQAELGGQATCADSCNGGLYR